MEAMRRYVSMLVVTYLDGNHIFQISFRFNNLI